MIRRIAFFAVVSLILSVVTVNAASFEKGKAAESSAEKWLRMIDEEKYAESWKDAAELFRNAVSQEQWEQSLQAVRKPLGKLLSRTIKSKTYKTSLPGAPDGEYVGKECRREQAFSTVGPDSRYRQWE